jgi:hypothetical protein
VGRLTRPALDGPPAGQWIDKHPSGWEPGATITATGGSICTRQADPIDPSEWDAILAELLPKGFDPAEYAIVGDSIQVRSWDAAVGGGRTERFYYYRATLTRRQQTLASDTDLVALRAAASRRKPGKRIQTVAADRALVVCLSDWQLGKGEGGGSAATIERIHDALDAVAERAKDERPASIVLAMLGDTVEGCVGCYPSQQFSVDLDDREQMRIATRLLLSAVDRFDRWPILVAATISNHGEKRQNGKAITGPLDSKDLELVDRLGDVMEANPDRYGAVRLVGPDASDPTVTRIDVHGVRVALTHGHVGFKGANASAAADAWLVGQIKGQRPAADAEVLITAHRHHLAIAELGVRRTWVQAPSMDGGSQWFASATGAQSHPGMLSMLVGDGVGRSGISGYEIH